ncbi:PEGA domain-containing protein [Flavimarina sp. Hel_I_48]|uniref:PEGA domain-containing protein n=1 Tax=Flavimarina sp. Hel_I_48 TaxID=1392488 RepID=UPI0004DEEE47|nr:PEGA domain-containing protein [Flavimarina sp. Hel_I_48]
MIYNFINRSVSLILVAILLMGCGSTTVIDSIPSNANLYINDQNVGQTPYKHRDSKIVGSSNSIRIEKEGYNSYKTSFSKDEKVAVAPLIGGVFFLVPFLWVMKYEKGHLYELIPKENQQ